MIEEDIDMKNIIIGACLFLAGSLIFSACIIYTAFDGCIPSEVLAERLLSVIMLVLGACLMAYEAYKAFINKDNK